MSLGTPTNLSGAVKPSSVEWDAYEGALFAHRSMDVPANLKMRIDYDVRTDGQPLYQGYAAKGLAEGTDGWLLYKYTYNVSNFITDRDVAYGNWTNRASETYE